MKMTMMRTAMLKMAFVFVLLAGCATGRSGSAGESVLTGKKWHLRELNGKPVVPKANGHGPYIELSATDGRYTGNAGCNGINGPYTLNGKNGITFSAGASTLMACADLDAEQTFMAVLEKTRSYSLKGNVLALQDEKGKTIAKLVENGEWRVSFQVFHRHSPFSTS